MHPEIRAHLPGLLALLLVGCLLAAVGVHAQDLARQLGANTELAEQPLKDLLMKRRAGGYIYVSVPQAVVLSAASAPGRSACMAQVQLSNSSSRTVEELVAGIRYTQGGKAAGSTFTQFTLIENGKHDVHAFPNVLSTPSCDDLTGELEVMHCVYDSGENCAGNVRASAYGAVPLTRVDRQ